ncbi:MAG: MFS transporter [Solirubrobacteraceae bacterium]|nr:MFS transporter [Solirubrobacteraceae bacterium]
MPATSPTFHLAGPRTRLSRPVAFAAIALMFVVFLAASSAPSPLYVVYQEAWGFSATTLTAVFAVYVVGLLGSLLVVGALSDHVGRRPVLGAAIALEMVALVLFAVAGDVYVLGLARVLQGIATGAAMTTLGAALVDLDPPHAPGRAGVINGIAPLSGLALGALGTGALVQIGPAPTTLVYLLLLGGMALAAAAVVWMPETSSLRPGARASLRPRVGIPPRLRGEVVALVPLLVASWALGGLYLSLGPSVASSIFDVHSHLAGGLVVTMLTGTGAATAFVLRTRPPAQVFTAAGVLLAAGMSVSLVGLETGAIEAAAVGTLIAGIGFGAAALGAFGSLARVAAPEERGEVFAVAYVISYVAFSVPAVIAGLASQSAGLLDTAAAYGAMVIALSLLALVAQRAVAQGREREERAAA